MNQNDSYRLRNAPGVSNRESSFSDFKTLTDPKSREGIGTERVYAIGEEHLDGDNYLSLSSKSDTASFHDRIRRGKVKLCNSCGGIMTKSSSMILSAPAAFAAIILGITLVIAYGFAVNFFNPAWHIKFALPAIYYIGSILVGSGLLFFFIRRKVWKCHKCNDMTTR